ncbi:MAG: nucleotide pyrophosphatase/phosphodiesterase family protein [Phycisphaeraceae bacterium]
MVKGTRVGRRGWVVGLLALMIGGAAVDVHAQGCPGQQAQRDGRVPETRGEVVTNRASPPGRLRWPGHPAHCSEADPGPIVFWLSIDGVRSDYLDRAETPNLDRLIAEGASSRELQPAFPSLTFPSHVSMATGAKPSEHGIPSNVFYDRDEDTVFAYPPWAWMLEAEPIWLTAARQGVRTAVIDWPLSHDQKGEVRTDYFDDRFPRGVSDEQRLTRVLQLWEDDQAGDHDAPLRLIMAYITGPDSVGHIHGPDSDVVIASMARTDELIGEMLEQITARFDQHPERAGYVIITTDHGMAKVETLVHLGHLSQVEGDERIQQATGGNVGHLFFKIEDTAEREKAVAEALAAIALHPFATAYRQDELPKAWGYEHPTRVGDVVVVLENGHTFSRRADGVSSPVDDRGPLGMHGYHPDTQPEMLGPAIFWRYPEPLGKTNLGPIHALQLHATVAQLLKITPAEQADPDAIELIEAE